MIRLRCRCGAVVGMTVMDAGMGRAHYVAVFASLDPPEEITHCPKCFRVLHGALTAGELTDAEVPA